MQAWDIVVKHLRQGNIMDKLTKDQRSRNMRRIHAKDTDIEIILRKALWNRGFRYRKNYDKIPGKPDITLTKYKIAIFCDSEFFHGKDWDKLKKQLQNSNNGQFWIEKIAKNRKRDDAVNKELIFWGWKVLRFWGKDIKKHTDECVKAVEEAVLEQIVGQENF